MERSQVLPISLPSVKAKSVFWGLTFLSFAAPFSLGDSQFLTGVAVNAVLFFSAVLLPRKLFLPIIVFPSLGVLSRGLIFGSLTNFLFYFIPFIWLANLTLILVFKKSFSYFGSWRGVLLASLIKLLILFSSAVLFFKLGLVPRLFLMAMGVNQLITACLGGFLLFGILEKIYDRKIKF